MSKSVRIIYFNFKVSISERNTSSSSEVKVKFIDYEYQCRIKESDLITMESCFNKNHLPSSIEVIKLDLNNEKSLTKLNKNQLEHLSEIFMNLVTYNQTCTAIGTSEKIHAARSNRGNNQTVRLFDKQRENLDINCIIEMCIELMINPYQCTLTHLENDYSQFDCVNKLVMSEQYENELQKIYRASG